MYVLVQMFAYAGACTCVHASARTHTHRETDRHVYMHACIRTCIQTYACVKSRLIDIETCVWTYVYTHLYMFAHSPTNLPTVKCLMVAQRRRLKTEGQVKLAAWGKQRGPGGFRFSA